MFLHLIHFYAYGFFMWCRVHSSERPGPGAAAGGVRPTQMRSSAASFAKISPEVIWGDGVGSSVFLFDIEHPFRYKTAWMGFRKFTHTVLVLHTLYACVRIFTFLFQPIDHARSFILYLPHEFVSINSDLPNLFTIVRQIGHVVDQAVSFIRPSSAFLNQCRCQSIFVEFIRKFFSGYGYRSSCTQICSEKLLDGGV